MKKRTIDNMMQKLVAVCILFILLGLNSIFLTSGINNQISCEQNIIHEKLMFGPRLSATQLPVSLLSKKIINNYEDYHKLTQEFYFDPSSCNLHDINDRVTYLEIDELNPSYSPLCPIVPMKTYEFTLPKETEVVGIEFTDVHFRKIETPLQLRKGPIPRFWTQDLDEENKLITQFLNKKRTDFDDQFYPGKIISHNIGEDSRKKTITVHLYPIQHHYNNKETLFINEGKINIYYLPHDEIPVQSTFDYDNVIITHPDLYEAAMDLKAFHDAEGLSTQVFNTTWIFNEYQEAEDPPIPGYSNSSTPGWDSIHGYNYSLAKRIITFLRDISPGSPLQYVTILGNARLVPPSYYTSCAGWIPTDLFYASLDTDLLPDFYIGRIPVNDSAQAHKVVQKIIHWNATSSLFSNITLAGGIPFDTPYLIGELMTIDPNNRGYFQGANINKLYRSDGTFTKSDVLAALTGESGLIYDIDHGSGDGWYVDGDSIYVDDILNLTHTDTSPIVISIACTNGAFDTHIWEDFDFNLSFGEAVLLSDAGGIAYIGGCRPNAGYPLFILEDGYLNIIKETYMGEMLTYVVQSYYENKQTLGEMTFDAMTNYFINNEFTDVFNNLTYFEFVLLGDPALRIPSRPTYQEYDQPYSGVDRPDGTIYTNSIPDLELPALFEEPDIGSIPIAITSENRNVSINTNSPHVELKLVDTAKTVNLTIDRLIITLENGTASYDLNPENSSLYCVRSCSDDGKEGWLYVISSRIVDDNFTSSTPGYNITRWSQIQDACNASNFGDYVYVRNGTYSEHITLDKEIQLLGEKPKNTIIDGNGTGSVVSITVNGTLLSGFTIQGNADQVGIEVNSILNKIVRNIIKNNHYGIYVHETKNNNRIYHNDFLQNEINAYDNARNRWYHLAFYGSTGNYWDDYNGTDDDGDGIGDTPYVIPPPAQYNWDRYPLMMPLFFINNTAPSAPNFTGPYYGRPQVPLFYSLEVYDAEGDDIYCMFNWGDNDPGQWMGPYQSGDVINISHVWQDDGFYNITYVLKDEYHQTPSSDPFEVLIESESPDVQITSPFHGLYLKNRRFLPFLPWTIIIGAVDIMVDSHDNLSGLERIEFYIDDELVATQTEDPYVFRWDDQAFFKHTIRVVGIDRAGNQNYHEIIVRKFF